MIIILRKTHINATKFYHENIPIFILKVITNLECTCTTKKMFYWIELAVLEINNIITLSALLRDNDIFALITIKKKTNRSGRRKERKIWLEFYLVQFFYSSEWRFYL